MARPSRLSSLLLAVMAAFSVSATAAFSPPAPLRSLFHAPNACGRTTKGTAIVGARMCQEGVARGGGVEWAIQKSEEESEEGKKIRDILTRMDKGGEVKPPNKLSKALKKASGAASLVPELSIEGGMDGVEVLSRASRVGQASALWVDASPPGAHEVLSRAVAEQATAKGKFPGPLPVVYRERVTHRAQIAHAAAAGAAGVVVGGEGDAGDVRGLVEACGMAGIEAVVEASDGEGVRRGVEAGARIVCVRGVGSAEEAAELRGAIPEGTVAISCVPAMQEGGEEVGEGQLLLAEGYHGVVLMDAAVEGGDDGYIEWVLGAFKSKKSRTFEFGTTGTIGQGDNTDTPLTLGAAQAAKEKNPTAWAKAKREAGMIMKDYRGGKRTLQSSKPKS